MKDKLFNALGTLGLILWWILSALYTIVPVVATEAPVLVQILFIAAILSLGPVGSVISIVIYVWAFVVTVQAPFTLASVVFYICLALWLVFEIIPLFSYFFTKRGE